MTRRPYRLVDVFGGLPFTGNPLAVVHDAEGLSAGQMQAIARWFNLSETAFLLAPVNPAADYHARIFTPAHQLPFAGHPTLGSAHSWIEAGGTPKLTDIIVQECGAGLVNIRRDQHRLAFAAPPVIHGGEPTDEELGEVIKVLRINASDIVDARWVDNGPGWIAILLESADAVLAIEPSRYYPMRIDVGVVGPYPPGNEAAFEIRAIYYDQRGTLVEDPVTGSLNASVAEWLFATGRASGNYIAAQGTCLGRTGRVHLMQDGTGQVWTGGNTFTLINGEIIC